MDKRNYAAFITGVCGALLCGSIALFFKGHLERDSFIIFGTVLAGMGAGFLSCFIIVKMALKILGNKNWKFAFVLGPVLGLVAGGISGAFTTLLIGPQYPWAAALTGFIIGALMGTIIGLILIPSLAFLMRK